jgi:hypothetical protein
MTTLISIETETGEEVPFWFTETDTRDLKGQLWDAHYGSKTVEIFRVFDHFHLSLEPLTRIVGRNEEESINEYFFREPLNEMITKYMQEKIVAIEAAWQPPETLLNLINTLLSAMEQTPNLFAELSITDDYFVEGWFCHDMMDLAHMLNWAVSKGITKVRIVEG